MTRFQLAFVGGALALHVGAWVVMGAIPKARKQSAVAIALAEAKKKDEQKKPKPLPPPPTEKPAAQTRTLAPAPKPAVAEALPPPAPVNDAPRPAAGDAPAAMDGFADLGLSLAGGGGSGMSVPVGSGGGGARPSASAPKETTQKVKQLAAADPGCIEDLVKPKLEHQVQPSYTAEAQQAGVEGKVRLELTIDATGHVTFVKVLAGLGFGLDEAAIGAAKQYTFAPATKCGRATPTTIKLGISFALQ